MWTVQGFIPNVNRYYSNFMKLGYFSQNPRQKQMKIKLLENFEVGSRDSDKFFDNFVLLAARTSPSKDSTARSHSHSYLEHLDFE